MYCGCVWKFRHVSRIISRFNLNGNFLASPTSLHHWLSPWIHNQQCDVIGQRNRAPTSIRIVFFFFFLFTAQTDKHTNTAQQWKFSYRWPWLILLNITEILLAVFFLSGSQFKFSLLLRRLMNVDFSLGYFWWRFFVEEFSFFFSREQYFVVVAFRSNDLLTRCRELCKSFVIYSLWLKFLLDSNPRKLHCEKLGHRFFAIVEWIFTLFYTFPYKFPNPFSSPTQQTHATLSFTSFQFPSMFLSLSLILFLMPQIEKIN